MLKIWGRTNSINVQKVLWLLTELDVPYERIDAGLSFGKTREPWFLEMNPNGLVPTIDDDGFILWESNAILRYLAQKHERVDLWPVDLCTRALAEQWMEWELSTLSRALAPLFQALIRKPARERDDALVERMTLECQQRFRVLDELLSERTFMLGSTFTLADIPIAAMVYRWLALPVAHGHAEHLGRYQRTISERPGFLQHVALPLS